MASISDLLKTYSLEELDQVATVVPKGMDTTSGERDVKLNNPLLYTTVEVEPAPIPEGAKLETRGTGLNEQQVLVGEDVGTNAFTHLLKGLADAASFGIWDLDESGKLWAPFGGSLEHTGSGYGREWDQKEQNRLLEVQRRTDLNEGRALPTRNEVNAALTYREGLDDYSDSRTRDKRDEYLDYLLAANPRIMEQISNQIFENRRREEQLNSAVSKNLNAAYGRSNSAKLANAEAYLRIAQGIASGLGRHSGIRNVAG